MKTRNSSLEQISAEPSFIRQFFSYLWSIFWLSILVDSVFWSLVSLAYLAPPNFRPLAIVVELGAVVWALKRSYGAKAAAATS
jgi:hypothetical protein